MPRGIPAPIRRGYKTTPACLAKKRQVSYTYNRWLKFFGSNRQGHIDTPMSMTRRKFPNIPPQTILAWSKLYG